MDYTENLKALEELLQTLQPKSQADPSKGRTESLNTQFQHKGQLEALEELIQKNEEEISAELGRLIGWALYRVSFVRELQEVNAHLSERIARIQSEGERPTVPTANAHLPTDN